MSDSGAKSDAHQTPDAKPAPQEEGSTLINVRVKDQAEYEVYYKMKPNTKLEKIANAFCNVTGKDPHAVRFLFDGTRIQANDTPESLEMQDGDLIDAMTEQTSGSGRVESPRADEESLRCSIEEDEEQAVEEPGIIKLRLKHDNVKELDFRIKRTVKLKRVMDAWYKQVDAKPGTLRFFIHGHRIQDNDTADSREIEEGDIVQVVLEQLGGAGEGSKNAETPAREDSPDNAEPAKSEVKKGTLSVKLKDQNENEIFFNIKFTTKFSKVFDAYYNKQDITPGSLRFLFDNMRIIEHQTPADLEMEDGDCIDVFLAQEGGGGSNGGADSDGSDHQDNPDDANAKPDDTGAKPELLKNAKGEQINLKVKDQDGNETFFKVRMSTKLEKVIQAYHTQRQAELGTYRLMFDGSRISPGDTPESLEMEDGDEIEVRVEQLGGRDDSLLQAKDNRSVEDDQDMENGEGLEQYESSGDGWTPDEDEALGDDASEEDENPEDDAGESSTGDMFGPAVAVDLNLQGPAEYAWEQVANDDLAQANNNFNIYDPSRDRRYVLIIATENDPGTLGAEVHYKIRKDTQLGNIMEDYATTKGVPAEELKFMFYDAPLLGNDTPQFLGMDDRDMIDVVWHQNLGDPVDVTQPEEPLYPVPYRELTISIFGLDNKTAPIRIHPDTPLQRLFNMWCQRERLAPTTVTFCFEDSPITPEDTANTLGMKFGDEIIVYKE